MRRALVLACCLTSAACSGLPSGPMPPVDPNPLASMHPVCMEQNERGCSWQVWVRDRGDETEQDQRIRILAGDVP